MPNFRRGVAAMNAASESSGNGSLPFVPNIGWREDREEKYILFLNPAEEIPTLDLHEWIEVGRRENGKPIYEWFISRKDAAIGESYDDIEDRLERKARIRSVAVAVELEPTLTMVNGRKRPTGFEVKTTSFERKTDGGTEEAHAPVIGFVIQSPLNFYGWVGTFSESEAPIEETPIKVVRRGKDQNTAYDFTPYIDQQVDFTNLIQYLDGVSYLADVIDQVNVDGDPKDAAAQIGQLMLDKRLDELADGERYQELVAPIQELDSKFGKPPAKSNPRPSPRPQDNGTGPVERSDKFSKLREAVAARASD